jgi:hypothetical protein
MENRIDRRIFFGKIGKATLVISLASMLPFKLFGRNKQPKKNIIVKIHPAAVKRNDKV